MNKNKTNNKKWISIPIFVGIIAAIPYANYFDNLKIHEKNKSKKNIEAIITQNSNQILIASDKENIKYHIQFEKNIRK